MTLAQNWDNKAGSVTDGTYAAFIVLETIGAVLCLVLVPSERVVRSDGSRVEKYVHPGIKSEFVGLYRTVVSDPWIILLFPMFFASNYFYTYQFNGAPAILPLPLPGSSLLTMKRCQLVLVLDASPRLQQCLLLADTDHRGCRLRRLSGLDSAVAPSPDRYRVGILVRHGHGSLGRRLRLPGQD